VRRREIARLYEADARGIVDEDLINEVGYGLFARCKSLLSVSDAYGKGLVQCPACGTEIRSNRRVEETIVCTACDWSLPWREFGRSTRRKYMVNIGGTGPFLRDYVRKFPRAKTPREKLILIDQLIHRYHGELENQPANPSAHNLIGGSRQQVIDFLNGLTYGEEGTPELSASFKQWHANLKRSQGL